MIKKTGKVQQKALTPKEEDKVNMLDNPVTMGELKYKKKKIPNVSMKQKPKSKHKSATQAFLTPQKAVKRRK